MLFTTLLILHISGATVGLLSGYLAMVLRKGSGWHGAAGTVFFAGMVLMTTTGAYIAMFLRPLMINVVASTLTFYLVVTAWRAARRREASAGAFDAGAALFILAVGVTAWMTGFEVAATPGRPKAGIPAAVYFFFGTIAFLCTITDVRMIVRGGVAGAQRIARHLWRMSLALLIATLSFYPGQAKLFPKWLRDTNVLMLPHLLLFGAMLYWLVRVKRRKRVQQNQGLEMVTPSLSRT
jgi:hypothetical protein